jgi:hypothetical protein
VAGLHLEGPRYAVSMIGVGMTATPPLRAVITLDEFIASNEDHLIEHHLFGLNGLGAAGPQTNTSKVSRLVAPNPGLDPGEGGRLSDYLREGSSPAGRHLSLARICA